MALDEGLGEHNGSADGVKYFSCREKHGIFVRSMGLQMAKMVDNDGVLKMMLEGVMVSEREVAKLTIPLFAVFLTNTRVFR